MKNKLLKKGIATLLVVASLVATTPSSLFAASFDNAASVSNLEASECSNVTKLPDGTLQSISTYKADGMTYTEVSRNSANVVSATISTPNSNEMFGYSANKATKKVVFTTFSGNTPVESFEVDINELEKLNENSIFEDTLGLNSIDIKDPKYNITTEPTALQGATPSVKATTKVSVGLGSTLSLKYKASKDNKYYGVSFGKKSKNFKRSDLSSAERSKVESYKTIVSNTKSHVKTLLVNVAEIAIFLKVAGTVVGGLLVASVLAAPEEAIAFAILSFAGILVTLYGATKDEIKKYVSNKTSALKKVGANLKSDYKKAKSTYNTVSKYKSCSVKWS